MDDELLKGMGSLKQWFDAVNTTFGLKLVRTFKALLVPLGHPVLDANLWK